LSNAAARTGSSRGRTPDPTVGQGAAELTAQFVSGSYRFVEIGGGGHFIIDQFPDRIARPVIEHIRSAAL